MLARAAAGVAAALVVVAGGFAVERVRLGASDADVMRRIVAEVREAVETIAADLAAIARAAAAQIDLVPTAPSDPEFVARLFDTAREALAPTPPGRSALTIFGGSGRPIAWSGRPSELPLDRLRAAPSLFMAPGPLGPRLIHVEPIAQDRATGRAGSIAAERVLGVDDPAEMAPTDTSMLPTRIAPVAVRARYEGATGASPPYGFVIIGPDGRPLLEAEVAPAALRDARMAHRAVTWSLALLVLALTTLVVAVPMLAWRERTRTPPALAAGTLLVATLIIGARILTTAAVPASWVWGADIAAPPLLHVLIYRSPVDLLATALCLLALTALAADVVERRRVAWRNRPRPAPGALRGAAFAATHLLAGAALGAVLLAYHFGLGRLVAGTPVDPLHVSLHPIEPRRLAFVLGLVALHAATLWAGVVLLRFAATTWRVERRRTGLRLATAALWLLPIGLTVGAPSVRDRLAGITPVLLAALAAVLLCGLVRWLAPRYRHASQALRLITAFLALAVPSLVFYPTLAALADQATDRVIRETLAPQAMAHRPALHVQLQRSLAQIDRIPGVIDLVASGRRADGEPPASDAAFAVWSQTELARQRLTSSVELYGADGTLVSRFALNLPAEASATQQWVETGCTWDIFGEPLAGTEDRVLLHAGRGLCDPTDSNARPEPEGAIVVHVMLDYGTLPFLASQGPYGELLQAAGEVRRDAHGRTIEFAMYGWGRTPVFPAEGSPWPISSELLARIYAAGRQPIWEMVPRGDRTYRVLFLNDRSGIYALGYEMARPVEHLIVLAEMVTLAGVAYVALLMLTGVVGALGGVRAGRGRALLREIRGSFYRKLFLAFVAAAVVPVLALALLTRAYVAGELRAGIEAAAGRTASTAKRVLGSVVSQQRREGTGPVLLTDEVMVSVSRVVNEDVNVFTGPRLAATSQRDLFASGRLPTRTPAEVYRAIVLERQASYVGEEQIGSFAYMIAAAPVGEGEVRTILTVPLALRQQEIEREIDALDRRVLLATVCFILLGAAIGYSMAERIADPVNRLTRATRRIARGDLDARIATTSADEFRRLVDAFNGMAADLQRQRGELERTHRLEAWAEMARQVAHDIKNPLTPIQLSAEHLRRVHHDRGEPLAPTLDSCVETILSQVRLLRQISSEFSSFAASPVARLAPAQVNDIVEEVLQPYRTAPAGRVDIVTELSSVIPAVPLDRTLVGRALVNVVENALHAMPGGGTLRVRTAVADRSVLVEVADTGVGMDADALSRLFEPYFSTRAAGTGLGLTIAKRNVELNGGSIAVHSVQGRGTTVHVRFPLPPGAEVPARLPDAPPR